MSINITTIEKLLSLVILLLQLILNEKEKELKKLKERESVNEIIDNV